MKVSDFDFELPSELIANHPLPTRDSSRMLVVGCSPPKEGTLDIQDKQFTDFVSYLRPGDIVVFNNSKVIPARFAATDALGREYEITLHTLSCGEKQWWGLSKKFNQLNIGDELTLEDGTKIRVLDKSDESGLFLEFLTDDVMAVLDRVGKMPLPPYMKRGEEQSDRDRYQTVYSVPLGSMAAPTAGLHFTPEILDAIRKAGAEIVNITLHIGAGTWMPVKVEDTENHKIHSEFGIITTEQADIINAAKSRGGRIIAIGTTSLRLLESAASGQDIEKFPSGRPQAGVVSPFCGNTEIFITPGYKFRVVDVLLTNFHLPKSTLFMLVSAFSGLPEMKAAYNHAVAEKYRFFSYGDCCLLFNSSI